MATHLVAYSQSITNITDTEINAVQDDVLTMSSAARFLVPNDYNNVQLAVALAATMGRARIVTPSLEVRRSTPYIIPHERAAIPSLTSPKVYVPSKPITLIPTEEISVKVTDSGTEQAAALILLGKGQLPPVPAGDVRRVRCTGTTTLTANKWTTCPITPDIQIEAGLYALVNMTAFSVGAIAARAIIQGQWNRPGVIAIPAASEAAAIAFSTEWTNINAPYEMGRFPHNVIPQIQFLSSSADVAETVYLDLVKVG